MRSVYLIVATLGLLGGLGCSSAPSRLYYETTTIKHPTVSEKNRKGLQANARKHLKEKRILTRRGAGRYKSEKAASIVRLPLAALSAIYLMGRKEMYGAESDLLIRVQGKGTVPVSVQVDLKGNMKLDIGGRRRAETAANAPTPRFAKGSVKWTSASQSSVHQAFGLLNPIEARIVKNLPFSRHKAGRGKHSDKGALYIQNGCRAEVRVYNRAFQADRHQFTGEARSPRPSSLRTVLHEIGHAIHNYPSRQLACTFAKKQRALKARIKRFNDTVSEYNRTRSPKLKRFLAQEQPRIQAGKSRLEKMAAQVERLASGGPILAAYRKVLGTDEGPTRYAETSIRESFAEAFSLYRSDPRALGRVLPQVLEWFKSGGHLRP